MLPAFRVQGDWEYSNPLMPNDDEEKLFALVETVSLGPYFIVDLHKEKMPYEIEETISDRRFIFDSGAAAMAIIENAEEKLNGFYLLNTLDLNNKRSAVATEVSEIWFVKDCYGSENFLFVMTDGEQLMDISSNGQRPSIYNKKLALLYKHGQLTIFGKDLYDM